MKIVGKILIILGCTFLLCSAVLFGYMHLKPNNADDIVNAVNAAIPEKSVGTTEDMPTEMPVLEIERNNVIALIKLDDYSLTLPVCDGWDAKKIRSMPRRFCGSVYDDSLVVGGADAVGQFSCLDSVEIGSEIVITDMNGSEYYYSVQKVDRSDNASSDSLVDNAFDLTLFMRDELSLEYIIVRCKR